MNDFRVSPTLLKTYKQCQQKAFYGYVKKIKPKKESVGLLRGRVVHNLNQLYFSFEGELALKHYINVVLRDHAGKDEIFTGLKEKFDWPAFQDKRSFFSFQQFKGQIEAAASAFFDYFEVNNIKPLILKEEPHFHIEELMPFDIGGVINRPKIDLLSQDLKIYDWKIGLRKYVTKNGIKPTDVNENLIAYAIAANRKYPDLFSFPVKTVTVHVVVKKKGEISDSISWTDGKVSIDGLEELKRNITKEDAEEYLEESRQSINSFLNESFVRNKSEQCITMCEFNRICLKGKEEFYVSR